MAESKHSAKVQMVEGSLWKNVPKFAIPVALTGILGQLFNAADIAVVGRFTGAQGTLSMAAVGANSAIVGLILNLFMGIALGANVVIATALGRKDEETVKQAVGTSVLFSFLTGALTALIGEVFAAPCLASLNVPSEVLPGAVLYLRIYLAGLPVILLYNFEAAIFRAAGETRLPLLVLAMSGALNVVLNLIFVIGLHMTVDGVAYATVISNAVSSAMLLVMLFRTQLPLRIAWCDIRFHAETLSGILRIGVPAGLQGAVFAIANILIQSAINSLGTTVIAASSAALNIEIFCYNVLSSFGQASTTFTGQNFGAGNLERCRKVLRVCLIEDAIAAASTVALVLLTGRQLLSIFNTDPEVIAIGYVRLVLILGSYAFSMCYEVMSGYMRGFGISFMPALLTTIGVCGTRFFWILAVFPRHRTFRMIMLVYPISLGITALLILLLLLYCRPAARFAAQQKKVS